MCSGCWRRHPDRIALALPRSRRDVAHAAGCMSARGCSICFSQCWCPCSLARSSNGSSGAGGRLSAARPTPSTLRRSTEPKPMPASRPPHAVTALRAGIRRRRDLAATRGRDADLCASLIAVSRLVLLAHHPSDVVAGALIGVIGAMAVRYWFAARQLGFAIRDDGKIVPLGAVAAASKGLPAGAFGPIRSGRRQRRSTLSWQADSHDERRFAFVRSSRGGFHRRSRAQRGREHRSA